MADVAEAAEAAALPEAAAPSEAAAPAEVLVRYFAGAAEAAGREQEVLPRVATVAELRADLVERHGAAMARVLEVGSLLVDGVVTRDPGRAIGDRVDVLPPFAGG